MANASPKQQIVQSVKDATNILIAVSKDPSVDELSAALGLTIFLNALGKHATAVFSGKVPPAITFLEPDKTFEDTADSLRDFIIALDKEKADHLRYKVVDDAVKIFITPYRTTISDQDLEFSQGDYNVELVLALNVENSDHLDVALEAHGRIFHDATIATITAGAIKSTLGATDWHDGSASGVSEMLVELIDGLKTPKATMDDQMATALLTGIVATTERFSNDLTSSKTMNAAAELMAAGANQQLITVQLEEANEKADDSDDNSSSSDEEDDSTILDEDKPAKVEKDSPKKKDKPVKKKENDGVLSINHEKKGDVDEVARQTRDEQQEEAARLAQDRLDSMSEPQEPETTPEALEQALSNPEPTEVAPLADLPPVVAPPEPSSATIEPQFEEMQIPTNAGTETTVDRAVGAASDLAEPSIGGTLNATTDLAADDKRRELLSDQNKTILRHGGTYTADEPAMGDTPLNAAMGESDEPPKIDLFDEAPNAVASEAPVMSALKADTNALSSTDHADARSEVDAALAAVPAQPQSTNIPTLADIEASQGLPPLPDFSTLPPPPPMPIGVVPDDIQSIEVPATIPQQSVSPQTSIPTVQPVEPQIQQEFNPGQFQIPGQ